MFVNFNHESLIFITNLDFLTVSQENRQINDLSFN